MGSSAVLWGCALGGRRAPVPHGRTGRALCPGPAAAGGAADVGRRARVGSTPAPRQPRQRAAGATLSPRADRCPRPRSVHARAAAHRHRRGARGRIGERTAAQDGGVAQRSMPPWHGCDGGRRAVVRTLGLGVKCRRAAFADEGQPDPASATEPAHQELSMVHVGARRILLPCWRSGDRAHGAGAVAARGWVVGSSPATQDRRERSRLCERVRPAGSGARGAVQDGMDRELVCAPGRCDRSVRSCSPVVRVVSQLPRRVRGKWVFYRLC